MGWQPIETAPKDGTHILLGGCKNGPSVRIGNWGSGQYNRRTRSYDPDWADGAGPLTGPTHWQPLPEPPK
jgi:hypothetical protein